MTAAVSAHMQVPVARMAECLSVALGHLPTKEAKFAAFNAQSVEDRALMREWGWCPYQRDDPVAADGFVRTMMRTVSNTVRAAVAT